MPRETTVSLRISWSAPASIAIQVKVSGHPCVWAQGELMGKQQPLFGNSFPQSLQTTSRSIIVNALQYNDIGADMRQHTRHGTRLQIAPQNIAQHKTGAISG